MITLKKLKIFEAFKGDFDAYTRSFRDNGNVDFIDNEWQLIQDFKHDIGLINKRLSSNDYNHRALAKIKVTQSKRYLSYFQIRFPDMLNFKRLD